MNEFDDLYREVILDHYKNPHNYGLIDDTGVGPAKGMPRAWSLTERGEGVLQAVGQG